MGKLKGVLVLVMIKTHSLLFHPILFCRITNNSIHFFSRHAKRSRDFDNKIFLTKIITILAKLLAV